MGCSQPWSLEKKQLVRGRRGAAGTPLLLGVVPWPRGPPPVVQASRQEGAVTGGGGGFTAGLDEGHCVSGTEAEVLGEVLSGADGRQHVARAHLAVPRA